MPLVLAVGFGVTAAIHLTSLLQNLRGFAAEDELHRSRHLANHDELTGLANRKSIMAELGRALDEAQRRNIVVGVLFLDLDRFKAVNDSMGHGVGDDLLRIVAKRLQNTVRSTDLVGRFGGDEFVMICSGLLQHDTVARIAKSIQASFATPINIRGSELMIRPSIGIATAGGSDPRSPEDVLRDADTAMYAAKRERSGFCVFDDRHRRAVVERMEVERELVPAFAANQFKVFYQPIVKWSENRLHSFEALVRWDHPEMGLVGPDRFLPLVEESGMMTQLGEIVLRETLSQHAVWSHDHRRARQVTVAVNVAESQLVDRNFPEVVDAAIRWAGLLPSQLTLEITEDVLIEHLDDSLSVLRNLHDLGVSLVIDDFGTGRSSLSWVKRLDMIEAFKIDRSFITGLPNGRVDIAIIEAIVGMASALDLKLVAEGVETVGQAYALRDLGVDLMQGYLFQRPAPADEIDVVGLMDPMTPLHSRETVAA